VGRAATVDEESLYRHLQAHPPFRAAFDVFWDEDYAAGRITLRFPFAQLPNFSGSPHSASAVRGGQDVEARALRLALENIARFFRDERPLHIVDRSEYET
jgi:phosphoglycerate dehydrogenase-like enzyme